MDNIKRVSLKDIANMVGVSPSTVSFVLNGKAKKMRISEAKASKILEIAHREGYQPNQAAVSLRTGKSNLLGLVVETISGNFFASLAKVIEDEAAEFGYRVVYCSTENNADKGQELIKMLSQRQVDGYIITPALGMEKDIRDLVAMRRPVVLMDSYIPDVNVPYVLVDNYGAVEIGMEHLIAKGYRRIGFITVDLDLIQLEKRNAAYYECLKKHAIPADDSLILKLSYRHNAQEAISYISSFIRNTKDLDVLFFATNYLGLLGLESIQQLNVNLPSDLAMISFDDHEVFRLFPRGITSIRQPVEEIARTAVHLLMEQMGKVNMVNRKTQVELPASLLERGTT
ncbi:MAG: substrate-binding domain-containing protein [Chitinophagaceae bacterium]